MTVRWFCPGCRWTTDQPDCVVSIGHRCNPAVPRTWRNLRRQEPPSTGGANQGKPSNSKGNTNANPR